MRKLIVLALTLVLAGCIAPSPAGSVPVDVPTIQPTAIATEEGLPPTESPAVVSTEVPAPESESAESPSSDLGPTERLFRVYLFHAIFEDSILKSIQAVADGTEEGEDVEIGIWAVSIMLTGIDDAFLLDWPDDMAVDVEVARRQQMAFKDTLAKWERNEITTAELPTLLPDVGIQANTLAFMEKLQAQGMTVEELRQMTTRAQTAFKESLDKSMDK